MKRVLLCLLALCSASSLAAPTTVKVDKSGMWSSDLKKPSYSLTLDIPKGYSVDDFYSLSSRIHVGMNGQPMESFVTLNLATEQVTFTPSGSYKKIKSQAGAQEILNIYKSTQPESQWDFTFHLLRKMSGPEKMWLMCEANVETQAQLDAFLKMCRAAKVK